MTKDTSFAVSKKDNRQDQIERLEVGDSVSVSRRLTLDFGLPKDTMSAHMHNLRGTLDQQCARAKRKKQERKFIVESGNYLTREGAIVLVATATRIE